MSGYSPLPSGSVNVRPPCSGLGAIIHALVNRNKSVTVAQAAGIQEELACSCGLVVVVARNRLRARATVLLQKAAGAER